MGFTPQQKKKILELAKEGYKATQISNKVNFSCTAQNVTTYLRYVGMTGTRFAWDESNGELLTNLWREGYTRKEIARRMDINYERVTRRIRQLLASHVIDERPCDACATTRNHW